MHIFSWKYRKVYKRRFFLAPFPTGGTKVLDTEVYTASGACVPVQGRELPVSKLPKDEEGGDAHKDLQEAHERCMPDLQAARCPLLSSREPVPGGEVRGAFLRQHQAQAQATTTAPAAAAGSTITVRKPLLNR